MNGWFSDRQTRLRYQVPMKKLILAILAFAGTPAAAAAAPAHPSAANPANWTIGPNARGTNYSRGVAARPSKVAGGFAIDLPGPGGRANYVTFPYGSLAGKSRIVMDFRIEAAPGVKIMPATGPDLPPLLTLYFQRRGDNWSGRGPFETYRWYASFATKQGLDPGTYRVVAPLSANWTAVMTSSARSQPMAFRAALDQAGEVGFVLGGGDGLGHGVFASGPARIVVTSYRIE